MRELILNLAGGKTRRRNRNFTEFQLAANFIWKKGN
jgi:hypothetical protein